MGQGPGEHSHGLPVVLSQCSLEDSTYNVCDTQGLDN